MLETPARARHVGLVEQVFRYKDLRVQAEIGWLTYDAAASRISTCLRIRDAWRWDVSVRRHSDGM